MRALVLSGGAYFGAWQAGAWAAVEPCFQPDLIVGASVGSLNGYAIACGATPDFLRELWLNENSVRISNLQKNLRDLAQSRRPRLDCAVVATDLLRMKPKVFRGEEITWRHLAASCAIPLILPQIRIEGRYYSDGGLLNPLPVYAAADLGATEILALHVLPSMPGSLLRTAVRVFRAFFGVDPALPAGVNLTVLAPPAPLGSATDAVRFKRDRVERWLQQGYADAERALAEKTFSNGIGFAR